MVRLSKPFYLSSPIVSIVAAPFIGVGTFYAMKNDVLGSLPYLIIGSAGMFYAGIVSMVLVYKMWQSIQDGHARTSPGKAIGFLFIPLFSFYWMFQVFWGFAKDYNSFIDRRGIDTRKLPEGLFLAFLILSLTTWIPFLGILTGIACLAVSVMVISQICDAVNALSGQPMQRIPPVVKPERGVARLSPRPLSLYCLVGEFAHETVVIPEEGIAIGRDPKRVNLVLAASEVSGVHARLKPEARSSQIWLEDVHSMNGTFYSQSPGKQDGDPGWVQLQGKILLSPGARFRLAVDGPEFEIRES